MSELAGLILDKVIRSITDAGFVIISLDKFRELDILHQPFEDDVECPYCAVRNIIVLPVDEEEVITKCVGCGRKFVSQYVQYLTAGEL